MITGKQMMIPMELRKNPNFLVELEHQCVKTLGYSQELFALAKNLVSYDPRERPTAEKVLKSLTKIRSSDKHGNLKLVFKDFNQLSDVLKIRVFSFLQIEDMYHVGLSCRQYYWLWEQHVSFFQFLTSSSIHIFLHVFNPIFPLTFYQIGNNVNAYNIYIQFYIVVEPIYEYQSRRGDFKEFFLSLFQTNSKKTSWERQQ